MSRRHGLDSRAWLVWGAAVMVPLLTGRHPLVLVELLLVVFVVRAVSLPQRRGAGWAWIVRLGAIAVPVGVLFNALTVHAGDMVIVRVPDRVPVMGGEITWNAVAYGLLSGLTIVVLVMAGTTVAAAIEWGALMRLIPARATGIAVAGSVAWTFLPQLATSWREIREAQAARGHQWRGMRDAVPLVVPLMAGGLDRSITIAEALEARGFGGGVHARAGRRWSATGLGLSLTALVSGLYLFAVGRSIAATTVVATALVVGMLAHRLAGETGLRMSHYRPARMMRDDWLVVACAVVAMLGVIVVLQVQPGALRYEPYPRLSWPVTSPVLAAALGLLLAPAVLSPAPVEDAR